MTYDEVIRDILYEGSSPLSAQEVLGKLVDVYITESKSWYRSHKHVGLASLIVIETKKPLSTVEIITNVIKNYLEPIPLTVLRESDPFIYLFFSFFSYYPNFIVLLPETLKALFSPQPYEFLYETELFEINRKISSVETCKLLAKIYLSIPTKWVDNFCKEIVDVIIENRTPERTEAALQALVNLSLRVSPEKSYPYIQKLLDLINNDVYVKHQDALISAIGNFAFKTNAILTTEVLEYLLLLVCLHKKENTAATMARLLALYPENEKSKLIEGSKATLVCASIPLKCFNIKMLSLLLTSKDSIEIKNLFLELINASNDVSINLAAIEGLSSRLSLCGAPEIEMIFNLTVDAVKSSDAKVSIKACEILAILCEHISVLQKDMILDKLADMIQSQQDAEIILARLNVVLEVLNHSEGGNITIEYKAQKLANNLVLHLNPRVSKSAQDIFVKLARINSEMISVNIDNILIAVQQESAPAANLIIALKPLFTDEQAHTIVKTLVKFYLATEPLHLKISAARVIGYYHDYIEGDAKQLMIQPLCKKVNKDLCETKAIVTLLDNLSILIDDNARKNLLKSTCWNVSSKNVPALIESLIRTVHDKDSNYYFLPFLAAAKYNDKTHHSVDDSYSSNLSFELGSLITDLIGEHQSWGAAPTFVENKSRCVIS